MTDDRMALADLLENGSDSDLLREMIGCVAQRLMQMDVEGVVGVAHGERGEGRENWRNGYRERDWHTRSGTIALRIPKLRRGSCFPAFLEPRRSSEKALAAVGAGSLRPGHLNARGSGILCVLGRLSYR